MNYTEEIQKLAAAPLVSDDYENDGSDRTSFLKDRVMPGIKKKTYGVAGAMAGAAVGAGLGLAGKKTTRAAYKKLYSPEVGKKLSQAFGESFGQSHEMAANLRKTRKALQKPIQFAFRPEFAKARAITAAGAGAFAMAPKGKEVGKIVGTANEFNKQYTKQFGYQPSEEELDKVLKLDTKNNKFHRSVSDFLYTPNAMTKSEFRDRKKVDGLMDTPYVRNKMASDYIEEIEKRAMSFDAMQQVGKTVNRLAKPLPYVLGGTGALLLGVPSYMAANGATYENDKHRKAKVGAATLAGTAIGGAVGGSIGKDMRDIATSVYDKVSDPMAAAQKMKDVAKDYKNLYKRTVETGKAIKKTFGK